MARVIGTIVGAVLGLLISYLFRPTIWGQSPTLLEWFDQFATQPQYSTTIAICAIVGALLGFVVGFFIDSQGKTEKPD